MSKGPYYANVKSISSSVSGHQILVVLSGTLSERTIELPKKFSIENLKVKDKICFYLSSPETKENGTQATSQRVVLLYKIDSYLFDDDRLPKICDWFYVYEGEKVLELEKLPKIIINLLSLSPFYNKRKVLVERALGILELTQDIDALDALFSMKCLRLYEVLGDRVCLCPYEDLIKLQPYTRDAIIEDAFIPVQIADLLVSLKNSGADIENPYKRDLMQVMALAIIHGTPYVIVRDFVNGYTRQ